MMRLLGLSSSSLLSSFNQLLLIHTSERLFHRFCLPDLATFIIEQGGGRGWGPHLWLPFVSTNKANKRKMLVVFTNVWKNGCFLLNAALTCWPTFFVWGFVFFFAAIFHFIRLKVCTDKHLRLFVLLFLLLFLRANVC